MTTSDWTPNGPVERDLLRARQQDDRDAFVRTLARADLVLPLLPEEVAYEQPLSWVTSEIGGMRHVLAFTSVATMNQLLDDEVPHRPVRFALLAETWPDPAMPLAVDPGLPIEAFLAADAVGELAQLASQPAPGREQTMHRAIEAGDVQAYATALLDGEVAVPLDPRLSAATDLAEPHFPWARLEQPGPMQGAVVMFSSPQRLRDQLGEHPHVATDFAQVAKAWPDEQTTLAVDPGTPIAAVLDGFLIATFGAQLRKLEEAGAETDPTGSEPGGTVVQVVIPAGQVGRYLQDGHRRAAGLIHRVPGGPVPIADLYARLGLLGEGSPFRAGDDEGFVLRWSDPDPQAYRSPSMDGIELPDGAALVAIDGTGGERRIAVFDARRGAWLAPPAR